MSKILVSGLINIETTLKIDSFPLEYNPANYPFFGIKSNVSGVGYNVAKALNVLGSETQLMAMIADDMAGDMVKKAFIKDDLNTQYLKENLTGTPQSVILYDQEGRRQIHTDLKDIQEQFYPIDEFKAAVKQAEIVCLCNINFSRHFIRKAKKMGKIIASDVHAISELDDEYNKDFMSAADILFMSDEEIPLPPKDWAKKVLEKYNPEILVIGLGKKGALLAVKKDNYLEIHPAIKTRKVINTVGAGDALFSAFIHFYNQNHNPYDALDKAMVFASYKIGTARAAKGFLTEEKLLDLSNRISN